MRYEDRLNARRERYLEKVEAAEKSANGCFQASRDATTFIPLGQPILIGHHSEKRHRADLARSERPMRQGIEANDKADYYCDQAAAVGREGISSDDERAVEKLKDKQAKLEARQERMKTANPAFRLKLSLSFSLEEFPVCNEAQVPVNRAVYGPA